jgi:hypothetical protein
VLIEIELDGEPASAICVLNEDESGKLCISATFVSVTPKMNLVLDGMPGMSMNELDRPN